MSTPRTALPTLPGTPPPLLLPPQVRYIYTGDRYIYTGDRYVYTEIATSTPKTDQDVLFCFSRFGQLPSYADLGLVLLPEHPALVAVVAPRPLATTRLWLGE